MKKDIHPTYYPKATVRCACGNTFHVGSTKETLETEICSNCHPFYTGKGKFVDAAGRIEKFKEKLEKQKKLKTAASAKKEKPKVKEKIRSTKTKILKSTSN